MKTRTVIIVLACIICLGGLIGVILQGQAIGRLRATLARGEAVRPSGETAKPAAPLTASAPTRTPPSLELLRLRSEVTKLKRRHEELAGVEAEQAQLKQQLADRPSGLPEGYVRKSEARMAGYSTPEDTFQTFFWAVQNKNVPVLLDCLTPESRQAFRRKLEQRGPDQFFEDSGGLPGFRITGREQPSADELVLQLEVVPGVRDDARFKLINGLWKLEM